MQKSEFDDRLEWLTEERCLMGRFAVYLARRTVSALLDYVANDRQRSNRG